MNTYCTSVFKGMDMAVESIVKIINTLNEEDLSIRPTADKMSIGELLAHMSVLCKADFLIGAGASEEEMDRFYEESEPESNLAAIAIALLENYNFLKKGIDSLTEQELLCETKSYWGGVHSRYEWLLDTQAHLYHHRGQLHAMMVHVMKRDPKVQLFE